MDGFEDNTGIVVMAATNRPSALDQALTRPGRFDRIVHLPLPNVEVGNRLHRPYNQNSTRPKQRRRQPPGLTHPSLAGPGACSRRFACTLARSRLPASSAAVAGPRAAARILRRRTLAPPDAPTTHERSALAPDPASCACLSSPRLAGPRRHPEGACPQQEGGPQLG